MSLKSIILSFAFTISVISSISATAEGESSAVSEAVASALGNAMRDIGLEISGGSLPAIEHMFSNWKNLKNPCGNAYKLIRAFIEDSNSNSYSSPQGFAFHRVMTETFGVPKPIFGTNTLAAQGEIISSRLWGKNRLQHKLRRLLREIALICNPPKPKPQVSLPAPATGVAAGGSGYQPPPKPPVKPPVKPKTPVKPKPAVKPPEPPKPPEPDWSVDNPCPECQPIANDLTAEKAKLKKLEAERAQEKENLDTSESEQAGIKEEIATIKSVVNAQKGTGGSSFDPGTGVTISSVNVGGGIVNVTTTDAYGNSSTVPRETSSSRSAKKKIKKLEKQLKKLKEEEKNIKEKIKDLDKKIAASKEKIKALQKALEDCIREKCKKGGDPKNALMMPGGGTPAGVGGSKTACTPTLKHDAIAIGPKDEIGTGFNKVAEDFARKLAGGGGLFSGGGFSSGGSESQENTAKPQTAKDPIKSRKKQKFTLPGTKIKVRVGATFDGDGNLLVSSEIDKAPGKGTFHDVTAHNIDCQQMRPIKYYVYDLYAKWNISVQYTETTTTNYYQDGALVGTETSIEQSDWMDYASGTEHLGTGKVGYGAGIKDDFAGIWRMSGFNRATSGNQAIGTKFNIDYKDMSNPFVISLKYTQPNEDPVMAVPLNLLTCPQEDGDIELVDVKKYLALKRHFDGGGVQIDPPTLDIDGTDSFGNQVIDVPRPQLNSADAVRLAEGLRKVCPGFYDEKIPKWLLHQNADREGRRKDDPDPNQAGEDFMNAFNHAFGKYEWSDLPIL